MKEIITIEKSGFWMTHAGYWNWIHDNKDEEEG
jgi:hypothetical protein